LEKDDVLTGKRF